MVVVAVVVVVFVAGVVLALVLVVVVSFVVGSWKAIRPAHVFGGEVFETTRKM